MEKPLLPPKSDSDVRAKLSTWKSAGETQTGKSEIKPIRVYIYTLGERWASWASGHPA